MTEIPAPPQLHFPSPYQRPSQAPSRAFFVERPDGARIATFVYGPRQEDPEEPPCGSSVRHAAGSLVEALAQSSTSSKAGIPVLFLHGNGEEHGIFGPIIDAVCAAGRYAIGVDSRAQGRSSRGGGPLTYEVMEEDALAILDALQVPRAHVLGFSDGAIEGLLLARDHPTRVASLVADGANLTPEGVVDDEGALLGARKALDAWTRYWQADHAETAQVDRELLTPSPAEAARTAELLRMMELEPHIEASSLVGISCPVVVVAGEYDEIAPQETETIARAIPDATLSIIPGCGHTLPKEAPDALTSILLDTIARAER